MTPYESNNLFGNLQPNLAVEAQLRYAIQMSGPITFAHLMQMSLHDELGYYNSAHVGIGSVGESIDFTTSPEAHESFGRTLANSFYAMWGALGRPDEFDVVEVGGGNGTLMRDIYRKIETDYPELHRTARYEIIEQSAHLVDKQRQLLAGTRVICSHEPATTARRSLKGVVYNNEFLDTIPVHRLIRMPEGIREFYVGLDTDGAFTELLGPVSLDAQNSFDQRELEEGVEHTVAPMIDVWQRRVAENLVQGYVLTVDYGIDQRGDRGRARQPRVYSRASPERTGYPVEYAYASLGAMDITTSVDFERLAASGIRYGLVPVVMTRQAEFLRQWGFEQERDRIIREYEAAGSGILPMTHYFSSYPLTAADGMGNFTVLVQSKNANPHLPALF